MDLARQAKVPIANETLVIVFNNAEATASLRSAALRLLASQKAPELAALVSSALYDKKDEVKTTALELLTERTLTRHYLRSNAVSRARTPSR